MRSAPYRARHVLRSPEVVDAQITRLIEPVFEGWSGDPRDMLAITLAFQEAITNSLEHGNLELTSDLKHEIDESGLDKYSKLKAERLALSPFRDRTIVVELNCDLQSLEITIEDQGKGFDVKSVESTAEERLDPSCYGRGMTIIHRTMDQVSFESRGRRITMRKALTPR